MHVDERRGRHHGEEVNALRAPRGRDHGNDRRHERGGGQTLAEFAIALIPFLFMLMGVVDLGRGIYTNNGVSQAAREIARVVSVHQCTGPCASGTYSAEALGVITVQKRLIPGLTNAGISVKCTDITNTLVTIAPGSICPPGDYIQVTVTASFGLVTPLLPVPNPYTLKSIAHVQVQAPDS
jgi:Flp pilus assembly protein TadG